MNTLRKNPFVLGMLALVLLQSCITDDFIGDGDPDVALPELVTINELALFPEGIDFNANTNEFIISSIARSEVGTVDPQTGAYTTFVTDPNLISVTGVLTDEERDRLLVVSGDIGFSANSVAAGTSAYLGIYDLDTGNLIQGVNLAAALPANTPVFANDVALDSYGNIYVTDSFSPVVYKVDSQTYEATVFVDGGDDFAPLEAGGIGLNGIVAVGSYLLVNKLDDGALFRIPLNNPEDYVQVQADPFVGGDGLELNAAGNVVLVENGFGPEPGTHELTSSDNWLSATSIGYFPVEADKFPTTAALAQGDVYVLNAYLGLAFAGDLTQETFEILRTDQ